MIKYIELNLNQNLDSEFLVENQPHQLDFLDLSEGAVLLKKIIDAMRCRFLITMALLW